MQNKFQYLFVDYIITKLFGNDYEQIYNTYLPSMITNLEIQQYKNIKYISQNKERKLLLVLVDDKYYDIVYKVSDNFFFLKELSPQTFYFKGLIEEFLDSEFVSNFITNNLNINKIFKYNEHFLTKLHYEAYSHSLKAYSVLENATKTYTRRITKYFVLEKYYDSEENITKDYIIKYFHEIERNIIKEHRQKMMNILKKIK